MQRWPPRERLRAEVIGALLAVVPLGCMLGALQPVILAGIPNLHWSGVVDAVQLLTLLLAAGLVGAVSGAVAIESRRKHRIAHAAFSGAVVACGIFVLFKIPILLVEGPPSDRFWFVFMFLLIADASFVCLLVQALVVRAIAAQPLPRPPRVVVAVCGAALVPALAFATFLNFFPSIAVRGLYMHGLEERWPQPFVLRVYDDDSSTSAEVELPGGAIKHCDATGYPLAPVRCEDESRYERQRRERRQAAPAE